MEHQRFFQRPAVQSIVGIIVILAVCAGILYWRSYTSFVSVDASIISAPIISIGPETEGILSSVYVKVGDTVAADQPLARIGSEVLASHASGIILSVQNMPGQVFMPGSAVITMIDPAQLRVVGKIDEDKGLARIKVGAPAEFTVDAFGSRIFTGVVDEVSPTSDQSSVVFSISDQRPTMQFDIKVRYNTLQYPELKNGMSAKLRIYVR